MAYNYVGVGRNSSSSNVTTYSPTAGNTLIFVSRTSSGGSPPPTVTAVATNNAASFTQRIATFQVAAGDWISVFTLENCPSGVTSVTATFSGGTPGTCDIIIVEYSGLATSSAYITSKSNHQAAPGTTANAITSTSTSVTVTTAAAVIGIVVNQENADTDAGTGFTARYGHDTDGQFFVEDQRITTTTSLAATATAATHGGTDYYTTILIAFGEPIVSTTITPGVGAVTLQGRAPSTSAFTAVRIREVLMNQSGQVVGSAANIRLMVWYGGQCRGAPDFSVNGQTSDANGTTSWSVATGTLALNDSIFFVAQDSISFSNYAAGRMTPSYE